MQPPDPDPAPAAAPPATEGPPSLYAIRNLATGNLLHTGDPSLPFVYVAPGIGPRDEPTHPGCEAVELVPAARLEAAEKQRDDARHVLRGFLSAFNHGEGTPESAARHAASMPAEIPWGPLCDAAKVVAGAANGPPADARERLAALIEGVRAMADACERGDRRGSDRVVADLRELADAAERGRNEPPSSEDVLGDIERSIGSMPTHREVSCCGVTSLRPHWHRCFVCPICGSSRRFFGFGGGVYAEDIVGAAIAYYERFRSADAEKGLSDG